MVDIHAYARIDDRQYPQNAAGVLARLIDTIGYRLYWALAELPDELLDRDPGSDHQTIRSLLHHIRALVGGSARALLATEPSDIDAGNNDVLAIYAIADHLARHIVELDNEQLFAISIGDRPLWSLINGQLSDALTHVGQINSLRRLFGYPVPAHDLPGGTGAR